MEEGSDHYTRTNNLLEAVVEAVSPHVFYSGLWECVATNATIRSALEQSQSNLSNLCFS